MRHSIGDKVHVWDGTNIVADVDGNEVVVYIRGVNLIYADDGNRTYYHFNAHGDVVVLTNSNGSKTKSYSYNAFGVEYNEATLDDNPFRYCGEYYDKETKTIYLRARYYNAEQGRFTQQDGWEYANPNDPLSLNLYTYCWNNPICYRDDLGRFPVFVAIALLVVGAVMLTGCSSTSSEYEYSPGPYSSADEAAQAFSALIYNSSLYTRHEYGTVIYSMDVDGETVYQYFDIFVGDPHSIPILLRVPEGATLVAYAHTHPNSKQFSPQDKEIARRNEIDAYVIGPDYELKKYDYESEKTENLGKIKAVSLTDEDKACLKDEFSDSWNKHLSEGCDFYCNKKTWPTAID